MVICSDEIQDFLSELYFREFATNVNTPRYYAIKEKLFQLDKPYIKRVPGRYPAWRNIYEIQIGCYIFGYNWDGQTACIEEYFREKIKENTNNTLNTNKKTVRLTEAKLQNIISEAISSVLREGKRDFRDV